MHNIYVFRLYATAVVIAAVILGCSDDPSGESQLQPDAAQDAAQSDGGDAGLSDAGLSDGGHVDADRGDADLSDVEPGDVSDSGDTDEGDAGEGDAGDADVDAPPAQTCGNGVREGSEACDGSDVPQACSGWSLAPTCNANCELNQCRGFFQVVPAGPSGAGVHSVSEDGSHLAYFLGDASDTITWYSLDLQTGASTTIASGINDAFANIFQSPTGRHAVVYEFMGPYRVWSEATQVTTTLSVPAVEDSIYVDDNVAAFLEETGNNRHEHSFHIFNHATLQTTKVLDQVFETSGPFEVSPDQEYAVVWTQDGYNGPMTIHFVELATATIVNSSPSSDMELAGYIRTGFFSATGNAYLFETNRGTAVWRRDTNTIMDAPTRDGSVWWSEFSPSGDKLAYATETGSYGGYEAWLWDLQTDTQTAITSTAGTIFAFSDDGTKLAYLDTPTGGRDSFELHILDIGTGADTLVDTDISDYSLDWSPDGEAIAYLDSVSGALYADYELEVADLAGGSALLYTVNRGGTSRVQWHPSSEGLTWQTFSGNTSTSKAGYWDRATQQATTLADDFSSSQSNAFVTSQSWDYILGRFSGAPIVEFVTSTQTQSDLSASTNVYSAWFGESPRYFTWGVRDDLSEVGPLHVYDLDTGTSSDLTLQPDARIVELVHGDATVIVVEAYESGPSYSDPTYYSFWIYRP